MRRKSFEITEKDEVEEVLNNVEYGILSMCSPNNTLYSIPLNFVYTNDLIYFHGAKEGKKAEVSLHVLPYTFLNLFL